MIRQKNVAKKMRGCLPKCHFRGHEENPHPAKPASLRGMTRRKAQTYGSALIMPDLGPCISDLIAVPLAKLWIAGPSPPEAVMLTKACNGFGTRRRDKPGHDEALRGASWLGPSCRRWCRPI